ncbi:hypothetical protein FGG08_001865 [Glutinoglossum americanum]|uniref:M6 family metalloprotease domain-containing protein n=1 Tax=Glutinoglossum americanum TaxID=1670608 RepID=A0A9P8IDX7_9PEZI|nr:hypothetical protein FGG08_001865 [Glutinoglossum americanum]
MAPLVETPLVSGSAIAVDEKRGRIWYGQADGTIGSVSMSNVSTKVVHQVLGSSIVALAVNDKILVAVHDSGKITSLDPANPTTPPTASVAGPSPPLGQARLSNAVPPTAAIVSIAKAPAPPHLPASALALVKMDSGLISSIEVPGLSGVALAGPLTYVAVNDSSTGRGEVASLQGFVTSSVASGIPAVGRLGLYDNGNVLLAVSIISATTGLVTTLGVTTFPGTLIEAQGLADGRIVFLTSDALVTVASINQLVAEPYIETPRPIFLGSWVRLYFGLGTKPLKPTEVYFEVPDGPKAGFVSYTRENYHGDPVPLLVVGEAVGTHKVLLMETATNTILAAGIFAITDLWTDRDAGPPGFYNANSVFAGDGGFGGGQPGPQNMNTTPHTGAWRCMVLMVDTTSAGWPTGAALIQNRTQIMGHITNGIAVGGVTRSTREYIEENSGFVAASPGSPGRGLTLSVSPNQAVGPVSMPNSWTDYFHQTVDAGGVVTDARWMSNDATVQSIVTRSLSDGLATEAQYANIDCLILVPFSPDQTAAGDRFVWPHASLGAGEYLCSLDANAPKRTFAITFVPLDFDIHDGRQMHSTLSHELGHTLGLYDLYSMRDVYSPDINARTTEGWDMMAGSRDSLPHYTIANKMGMGWVPASNLKLYNFRVGGAVDESVALHAAEIASPSAGRFQAIEIRIGDGRNYYVEYRASQTGEITDNPLNMNRTVVITDVISGRFSPTSTRPSIIFVRKDIDGDGPLLGIGKDLKEKDPGTAMDMAVTVVSTAADNAVVKVTYGSNGKPEPGIRTWSGAASNWQSPDIEVRNVKAAADPGKFFNVPWLDHGNQVVAKIRNSGDLLANGVVVDFFVTEFSSGDGPLDPLGSAVEDVPAGAVVEFTAPDSWWPLSDGTKHYCIIVRIRLYQDPGNPLIVDNNIYNNEARSNYTQFNTASASPSVRVGTNVLLANPYLRDTDVLANVQKTHRSHRIFTSHQWRRVPGKQALPIAVWDESTFGTPQWGNDNIDDLYSTPNRLSISGWALAPLPPDVQCGSRFLTGGVGMRIDAGQETQIKIRQNLRDIVAGQVIFRGTETPVPAPQDQNPILVELAIDPDASPLVKTVVVQEALASDGTFVHKMTDEELDYKFAQVHYLGSFGASPSETKRFLLT